MTKREEEIAEAVGIANSKLLRNLIRSLEVGFGPPLMPPGFVEAEMLDHNPHSARLLVQLCIGDREVLLDTNGNIHSGSTRIGLNSNWDIQPGMR